MGKRELVALLYLSSWCLVMVGRLFLAVPWGCLRFVIVVFPDHTHLLFLQVHRSYDVEDTEQRFMFVLDLTSRSKSNIVHLYFLVNASPKPLEIATSNFADALAR